MHEALSFVLGEVGWQVLPEADYIIARPNVPIWIERKSIRDFLSSIGDGRLFRQVDALVESATKVNGVPVVLLEGIWHPVATAKGYFVKPDKARRPTGWSVASFTGAMLSIQAKGAKILTSSSTTDTISLILALAGHKVEVA